MRLRVLVGAGVLALAGIARAAESPHWVSILPLSERYQDALARDAAFLGDKTICDGIAWSCTLVPEGNPVMDKARVYAARFRDICRRVRKQSTVRQGVLIQATIGHGWKPGSPTPWQTVVWADGGTSYRFCPLGIEFRRYVTAQLRALAAEGPDFFMVDDDTKLLGKVDGCFCPLHVKGFSEQTGRVWTREDLADAVANDPAVSSAWRAYTEASVVDYVRLIRAAFPDTVPGSFCTVSGPGPRMGFVQPCAVVLAGPSARPVVRIGSAPYWSDGLFDILDVRRDVARQLAFLGPSVDVLAEADTCPQVRWQTSATRALDHVTILTAEGCRGAKMWWHRLANTHETQSSAAYLRALGARSGQLRSLEAAGFAAEGVWCPSDSGQPEWGSNVFGLLGFAYRYGTHRPGEIAALTAASSASLNVETLTNLLSGPVLLDGAGAVALTARGFGDLIGVRAKPWTGAAIIYEGIAGERLFASQGGSPADLSAMQARAIPQTRLYNRVTWMSDEETYLAPGSVWFENRLGGRVLTLSASVPKSPMYLTEFGFCNETRKRWLVMMLSRLVGALPGGAVCLGDQPVLCEAGRTSAGEKMLILDNLDLDALEDPELMFDRMPVRIERLTDKGEWKGVEVRLTGRNRAVLRTLLQTHVPGIFRLSMEEES